MRLIIFVEICKALWWLDERFARLAARLHRRRRLEI